MIHLVTDSSCDLPADLVTGQPVAIVPLTVRFGKEEFVDRLDLSPSEFWARAHASPVLPETAAPAPGAFTQAFREAAEGGATGVVCITLSSRLSATYQSAQTAAGEVCDEVPVRVVDSASVTMGLGTIVLEAARLAAEGGTLEEVAEGAREVAGRTRVYGTLDTLENLKKGGRIGAASALLGSVLSIKPVIEVRDGLVEPESRQRTRSRALRHIADTVAAHRPLEVLAVLDAAAPDLGTLLELLAPVHPPEDTLVADIGPVIGAHAGPRTVGVAFRVTRAAGATAG